MGCGVAGATRWFRRLNPNVRNRLLYDFLIYAGAGMWARYGLMHDADQSGRHARIARRCRQGKQQPASMRRAQDACAAAAKLTPYPAACHFTGLRWWESH